jgi:hypothetical protein
MRTRVRINIRSARNISIIDNRHCENRRLIAIYSLVASNSEEEYESG